MRKCKNIIVSVIVLSMALCMMAGCTRTAKVKVTDSKDNEETEEKTVNKAEYDQTFDTKDGLTDDEEETTTKKSSSKNNNSKNNDLDMSDWKEYEGSNYSIKLSEDWLEVNYSGAELAFTYPETSKDDFSESINVVVQDLSSYDLDLESYKDLSLKQYEDLEYNIDDVYKKTIDGQKGYCFKVSCEQRGVQCKVFQFFTIIDEKAYVFTFAADVDSYSELEDEVTIIFESIEF